MNDPEPDQMPPWQERFGAVFVQANRTGWVTRLRRDIERIAQPLIDTCNRTGLLFHVLDAARDPAAHRRCATCHPRAFPAPVRGRKPSMPPRQAARWNRRKR